jgi:P27 family predicted phage terminase small subunit
MTKPLTEGRASQTASIADQREQLKALTKENLAAVLPRDSQPRRKLSPTGLDNWKFILDNVAEGQLLMTDIPLLEQYCEVLAKLDEFTRMLPEQKFESFSAKGTPVANPFFTVFSTLTSQATTFAQRLRLMPSMRQMSQSEKKSQDTRGDEGKTRKPSARAHLLFGGGNVVPLHGDDNDDS